MSEDQLSHRRWADRSGGGDWHNTPVNGNPEPGTLYGLSIDNRVSDPWWRRLPLRPTS